jgi:hypothetical protein
MASYCWRVKSFQDLLLNNFILSYPHSVFVSKDVTRDSEVQKCNGVNGQGCDRLERLGVLIVSFLYQCQPSRSDR